jgi:putative peptidoglycan lipid II flippase
MAAAALLMSVAVGLSRVLGYVRDAYIAWAFGAGPATDAYTAAFTVPDFLNYALAGGALSITFIPIYTGYLARQQHAEGERVFHVVVTTMGLVMGGGVLLMEAAAGWIVPRLVPDFDPAQLALCVRLTRILLPSQVFFYVGGIVSATLQARQLFLAPAAAPLLYNLGILAGGAALGRAVGVESLAWGAMAGAFVGPFLVPVVAAARALRREAAAGGPAVIPFRLRVDAGDAGFREWLRLSVPLMIGFSLTTADEWIMRYFASGAAGTIFRINLARRLLLVPVAVLAQAAGQATLPFFARLDAEGKREELGRELRGAVQAVWAATALAGAWLVALAYPVVRLLYQRGGYTLADADQTAALLVALAVSTPLWGAQAILARGFYATRNTWTPMVAGTAVTLGSIPLFWAGWRLGGALGLAAASSAGMFVHAGVLGLLVRRRLPGAVGVALLSGAARALVVAAAAGAGAWSAAWALAQAGLPARPVWLGAVAQCLGGSAAFAAIVFPAARLLGVEEVDALRRRLAARLARVLRRRAAP